MPSARTSHALINTLFSHLMLHQHRTNNLLGMRIQLDNIGFTRPAALPVTGSEDADCGWFAINVFTFYLTTLFCSIHYSVAVHHDAFASSPHSQLMPVLLLTSDVAT